MLQQLLACSFPYISDIHTDYFWCKRTVLRLTTSSSSSSSARGTSFPLPLPEEISRIKSNKGIYKNKVFTGTINTDGVAIYIISPISHSLPCFLSLNCANPLASNANWNTPKPSTSRNWYGLEWEHCDNAWGHVGGVLWSIGMHLF